MNPQDFQQTEERYQMIQGKYYKLNSRFELGSISCTLLNKIKWIIVSI